MIAAGCCCQRNYEIIWENKSSKKEQTWITRHQDPRTL